MVEYCIERIFSWRIQNVAGGNFTTWELREALNDVTNDKKRIGYMVTECLGGGCQPEASTDLAKACRQMLDSVDKNYPEGEQWALLLYRVRSLIVHTQLRLLRTGSFALVLPVNEALRAVCFNLVSCFRKP